ncbi:hypothetical protein KO488_03960 [Poseidonibacter lekithochrous]|uniref:hypothetical protein n=1 Tax=Poseidonibacter TaxID=2321187 RepID=UPI001C0A0FC2|nr:MULTISPECIES: hypothetical protein [Poseidonibacter]MBU3013900.1 hypothetical protein [Poseidonibacter lekithochrous]MDO6827195.1 hypothetical protein [Poseidonibacter sp. 1_MG-2023]
MENIKEELKKVIEEVMLPESEDYSKELANLIVRNEVSQDNIDAKEDIDSFIEELKNILEIIKENKLSDEEAEGIYEKIITMLNEHEEDH